jgi:hypothetical protein
LSHIKDLAYSARFRAYTRLGFTAQQLACALLRFSRWTDRRLGLGDLEPWPPGGWEESDLAEDPYHEGICSYCQHAVPVKTIGSCRPGCTESICQSCETGLLCSDCGGPI